MLCRFKLDYFTKVYKNFPRIPLIGALPRIGALCAWTEVPRFAGFHCTSHDSIVIYFTDLTIWETSSLRALN